MQIRTAIKSISGAIRLIENWPLFLRNYLNTTSKKYVTYKLRNGIKLKVTARESDVVIIEGVWIHRFYNPRGFEIKEGDTVVDIGAHLGIFSVFASRNNRNGKIFALEPSPKNFKLLKYNIKVNKIKNIVPIKKAVSNLDGKKKLFLGFIDSGNSLLDWQYVKKEYINVRTATLKSFFKKYHVKQIDFLKIDAEGAEYEILFNCQNNIFKKIKKISLECHNIDKKRNVFKLKKFLERKGFKVKIRKPIGKISNMVYARQK
jgi:FkbM family methyltransferase